MKLHRALHLNKSCSSIAQFLRARDFCDDVGTWICWGGGGGCSDSVSVGGGGGWYEDGDVGMRYCARPRYSKIRVIGPEVVSDIRANQNVKKDRVSENGKVIEEVAKSNRT